MQQADENALYATMRPARGGRSLVTFSTYEERQEALRNTSIMEDDVNHRASRVFPNNSTTTNGSQVQMPPPPPQFASSPPRTQQQQQYNNVSNNIKFLPSQQQQQQQQQQKPIINHYSNSNGAFNAPTEQPPKPPATPVPDYDNVDLLHTKPTTTTSSSVRPSYGYASTNIVTNGRDSSNDNNSNINNNKNNNSNRHNLRPGTITIGEYEQPQQRREPAKFDFVATPKRSNGTIEANAENLQAELQNTLTRSKLKKSAEQLEHHSNCPLRNNYENYENVARKLHSVSINEVATTAPPAPRMSNGNGGTNGILKNGNRHSGGGGGSGSSKNSDKTITFGN